MNEHELALVLDDDFIVRLDGFLDHVIHELILRETRTRDDHTFYNVEIYVPDNSLHHAFVKSIQTLKHEINKVEFEFYMKRGLRVK